MNFRINTLGKKIGLGYALITLILAIAVTVTIVQVNGIQSTADRLGNLRVPTARNSQLIITGLYRSTAALRGWVLINEDRFKVERKNAWSEEIRIALGEMDALSENWTSSKNIAQLRTVKPLIEDLNDLQNRIEQIAENDRDRARNILDEEALPLVLKIKRILEEISVDQNIQMSADLELAAEQTSKLRNMEWTLFGIGILASLILAYIVTRSISKPVSEAVEVARNIGQGDLDTKVNVTGSKELEYLGNALIEMRDSLKKKTIEAQQYEWLTTGQNRLNEAMRGDKDVNELANSIVTFMGKYTGASIGAIYLMDDSGTEIALAGRYAFDDEKVKKSFKMNEGVIGQAAASKQSIELTELEDMDIHIRSSVVDAVPKNILVTPFLFENKTLGVLELGKLGLFEDTHKEFVETNMEPVAITLNSAVARRKIKELLEETQKQSEELQQQQEELEQSNEELEEQTQKLKEQQEELQASNEELEETAQIVEQKNKDLETARTDIEIKAKQLEISSKYKSEFLANMSHELRTPLNSLLILSNDLATNKEKNLNEEQIESAQVITKSGHDLLNLINEILDLSKIEAGKMELNLQTVTIEEVADDLKRNFKRSAEKKGLTFDISVEQKLPSKIKTDLQRLEQILKNLISNAIKFTEKGNVAVHFSQGVTDDHLAIKVEDSGIGIPKEKKEIIFEAFQQAEGGISRKYGGTGLGLSISRELAKLLGGQITVDSEEGKGSSFTLVIPIKTEEQEETETVQEKPRSPEKSKPNFKAGSEFVNYPTIEDQRNDISAEDNSILIVEDDNEFARVLGLQANEKGFKFLSAATGEDGLLMATQYQPNAIILDLDLPGINGHMVLKELKGNPNLRHIPVHIISANEKTLDPIRSGAVEYITKPVTKGQLDEAFGRIEDFVSRKMKNLLLVEDNDTLRSSIVKLIGNGDVKCYEAATAKEAVELFDQQKIDCMVLDIGLPDMSGFELIKKLEKHLEGNVPPVIVYTGKELSKKESEELEQYAETIIVKGVKSEERLLDETALFLHRTVRDLPKTKQEMITGLYDKETLFHGKKVLLVDDDMRNVFALGKVLKEKGLNIIKAENGKVALNILAEDLEIDLVLMDIMMPEMDGYTCMKKIRKQKRFSDLPIIALTAKAMKEDRQKCIDTGANDYISKPVDVERLLSLMRVWIKK